MRARNPNDLRPRAPPVAKVAIAHATGVALPLLGADLPPALFLTALLVGLLLLWTRPWPVGALVVATMGGMASGQAVLRSRELDCRLALPVHWEGIVEGRFTVRPVPGRSLPFEVEAGGAGDCAGELRAVVAPRSSSPRAGERIRVAASWEGRAFPDEAWADRAGIYRLGVDWSPAGRAGLRDRLLAARGAVQEQIFALWGDDMGPVVEALVLARTEHLDPQLRDAFALAGTAHIISISGFHVGVVAALFLGLLRALGFGRARAEWGAVVGCWLYVLGIGAPHAAVRAVVLLSLLAWARSRGRPVMDIGALASALLLLLFIRPDWLLSIGFQLSFAGVAGLIVLRPPIVAWLTRALERQDRDAGTRGAAHGLSKRLVRAGVESVAAGVAATLATFPLVAWHFDRASLMSVPATLAVAPAVTIAIPGIGAALLASVLSLDLGRFLAGGSALLLEVMVRGSVTFAELPGSSIWVSREVLVASGGAFAATLVFLRSRLPRKVRPALRRSAAALVASAIVIVLPISRGGGDLEVHVIDVGQGDAVALRLPSGKWMLVDAGPRGPGFDAGARRVVPYLRRLGVTELEAVVLTHPHLDHIGGVAAVFRGLRVRGVLDPSHPAPSRDYLGVLEAAAESGTAWWRASAPLAAEIDGVRVTLLSPDAEAARAERVEDLNDLSVVALVQWEEAAVLLTGDAPAEVEHRVLQELPRLSVLKLGHHGSRTSTSPELLEHARPRVAVLSAGDGNQFGHPHAEVTERLDLAEVPVYRTDRDGDVRLVVRPDGSVEAHVSR